MFAVILVLVAGGSFYGGMQYQGSKDATSATASAGAAGGAARRAFAGAGGARGAAGGGATAGTVLSVDNQGLTLQLRDGSSKVVFVTPSTTVQKMVDGAVGDILPQSNVTVMGATNSDGSVTATAVQIRPAGMFGQAPGSVTSTSPAPTATSTK